MLVIEQTKEQPLKWQNINWTAVEGQVRRLQERMYLISGSLPSLETGKL